MLECQLLSRLSILVSVTLQTEQLGAPGLQFTGASDPFYFFFAVGVGKTGTSLSSVAVTFNDFLCVQQKCLRIRELQAGLVC